MENKDIELILENIAAAHGDAFVADSIKDSFHKAASANVPDDLKTLLQALALAIGKMCAILPQSQSWQPASALQRLIDEAASEKLKPQWWEISLDTLWKAAKGAAQVGQPIIDLVAALKPILEQRFGPYRTISLREITADNVMDICHLSDTLTEPKKNFVAQNVYSIVQGHYSETAWFRAIYAGEAPVGFLMLHDDPKEPEYFLWRFMIAEPYHGRGFGRRAIELLIEHVKTRPGAKELLVSCGQGEGGPEGFYVGLGFKHNGKKYDSEIGLSLAL